MTTLVVGANGATGRLLVQQLLNENKEVRIIVRSINELPETMKNDPRLSITQDNLLAMSHTQLKDQVQGCKAVVSCLGHNFTFKGMFGQPRRLVTEAVQRLCFAIEAVDSADIFPQIKFILMNTTGNQNTQAGEKISISQSLIIRLIRLLLPPHVDNEEAAKYLQSYYGAHQHKIEWTAVRPDSLINENSITDYQVFSSPIRSAIFDAGKTSRINVAHFMSQLISNQEIWDKWKRQMPVIYNKEY